MKKEVADKWVAALRSGEYAQTRELLRDRQGFCCLGVLCDISGQGQWKQYEGEDSDSVNVGAHEYHVGEKAALGLLGPEVIEWAGMMAGNVSGEYGSDTTALSFKNDMGVTFDEIADIIEKHWESL